MSERKTNWHRLTAEESLRQLGSHWEGLSGRDAATRLKKNGRNTLFDVPKKRDETLRRFFTDPSLLLFVSVAVLTLCFSEFMLALPALILFVIWYGFAVWQLLRMTRSRERLERCGIPTVTALRNRKILNVSAGNITVGDVLLLQRGDVVPADCRLLSSSEFRVRFFYGDRFEKGKRGVVQSKNAEIVYPYQTEVSAPNYENLLYAGSEVEAGKARAVVFATGGETFLGMQGGSIRCNSFEKEFQTVSKLYPYAKLWNFFALMLLLPVGIFGLLISPDSQSGMRVFLPICAWVATSAAVLPYCYLRFLFHHEIRRLYRRNAKENGALIQSTKAMDRIPDLTDLILLGKGAISDGRLHLHSVFSGEGTVLPENMEHSAVAQELCEAFCLLERAVGRLPNQVNTSVVRTEPYLSELVEGCQYDCEALALRVQKTELYRGKLERILDVETTEGAFRLRFYYTKASLFGCGEYLKNDGTAGVLDGTLRQAYRDFWERAITAGCSVVSVVKEQRGTVRLIGCLVKRQELLNRLSQTKEELEQFGVHTRLFLTDENAENLAYAATFASGAKIAEASQNANIGDVFDKAHVFLGYSPQQIATAVRELKKRGNVVGAVTCDVSYQGVMKCASVSIGCDAFTSDGADSQCNPILQMRSDVLIPRASQKGGGLSAVKQAVTVLRQAVFCADRFFESYVALRLMQATVMVLSVLLGMGSLPAYTVLYTSFLTDVLLLIQTLDRSTHQAVSDNESSHKKYGSAAFLKDKKMWMNAILPPVVLMVLVAIFYHTALMTLGACYTALFFGMLLLGTLKLTVGRKGTKIDRKILSWLLALWIPALILSLASHFSSTVQSVTELGSWSWMTFIPVLLSASAEIILLILSLKER